MSAGEVWICSWSACGRTFTIRRRADSPTHERYCSRKCFHGAKRDQRVAREAQREHVRIHRARCARTCRACGASFTGSRGQLCSDICRRRFACERQRRYAAAKHTVVERECKACGTPFSSEYGRKLRVFCSKACAQRYQRRVSHGVKRARTHGARRIEQVDPRQVFIRDGWQCWICERPIDPSIRHPHPMSASMDHVVPLAHGGDHTWANVKASHLICNVTRSADEQREQIAVGGERSPGIGWRIPPRGLRDTPSKVRWGGVA